MSAYSQQTGWISMSCSMQILRTSKNGVVIFCDFSLKGWGRAVVPVLWITSEQNEMMRTGLI